MPGETIRLTTDSPESLIGNYAPAPLRWQQGVLDSIGSRYVWMRTRDGSLAVPLEVLQSLQVLRARRSPVTVLAYGLLAGAGLGALTGFLTPGMSWNESVDYAIVPSAAFGFGMSFIFLPALTKGWRSVPATPALARPAAFQR